MRDGKNQRERSKPKFYKWRGAQVQRIAHGMAIHLTRPAGSVPANLDRIQSAVQPASMRHGVHVNRVTDEQSREDVLSVMRVIYRDEKNWLEDDERLIARADITSKIASWFVARVQGKPVGVLRVLYKPQLELYQSYRFKVVAGDIDIAAFVRSNKIAELGRFAILPEFRRNVRVAAGLMGAASLDTLEHGFTHYITDVFEGEQHSPYKFSLRVMGFQVVATHEKGELNCACRRITMLLDLKQTYHRLRLRNNWIFRTLTSNWDDRLHERMMTNGHLQAPSHDLPASQDHAVGQGFVEFCPSE